MKDYLRKNIISLLSLLVAILSGGRAIMENLKTITQYIGHNIWTIISILSFSLFIVLQIWLRIDKAIETYKADRQKHEDEDRAFRVRSIQRDELLFRQVQEIQRRLGLPVTPDKEFFRN